MAHIDIFQNPLNKDERLEFEIEYIEPRHYGFNHGAEARFRIGLGDEKICIFMLDPCVTEITELRDKIDQYLAHARAQEAESAQKIAL